MDIVLSSDRSDGVNWRIEQLMKLNDESKWLEKLAVLDSEGCKKDLRVYLDQLQNGTLWASKSKFKFPILLV